MVRETQCAGDFPPPAPVTTATLSSNLTDAADELRLRVCTWVRARSRGLLMLVIMVDTY